ncbi:response regulator transcription factor [Fulvivirga sp. M361]|uniref:response regulator transcription factor n=1 Tax=Fulvivirga sp. M361 TaxID=2594266 RepID=UPI001179ED83|nr:response regulator transcription factor [Fulvivirga sp. M361]TRX60809.1 response regulator transcription factor [Fulvivirga sp. M361]
MTFFYTQVALISKDILLLDDYTRVLDVSSKFLLVEHFESVSNLSAKRRILERIDVLIFDLGTIEVSELIKLKTAFPLKRVLVINSGSTDVLKAMAVGIDGFLSDRRDFRELLNQISTLMNGNKTLDQISIQYLFNYFKKELQSDLTVREREVLEELSLNRSYKQIADKLAISTATVKTHLEHVYDKLDADNKFDAIDKARIKKLI